MAERIPPPPNTTGQGKPVTIEEMKRKILIDKLKQQGTPVPFDGKQPAGGFVRG